MSFLCFQCHLSKCTLFKGNKMFYLMFQARLVELETPKRMEHLQKLEDLKRHLLELEKQVSSNELSFDYYIQLQKLRTTGMLLQCVLTIKCNIISNDYHFSALIVSVLKDAKCFFTNGIFQYTNKMTCYIIFQHTIFARVFHIFLKFYLSTFNKNMNIYSRGPTGPL